MLILLRERGRIIYKTKTDIYIYIYMSRDFLIWRTGEANKIYMETLINELYVLSEHFLQNN